MNSDEDRAATSGAPALTGILPARPNVFSGLGPRLVPSVTPKLVDYAARACMI
jgi:hypothetical protein